MSTSSPPENITIDTEWAESLVGLRMQVPGHWWPGFSGNELNPGTIRALDFNEASSRFFQLELDSELGAFYPMRYDAVLHYADEVHPCFSRYRLPNEPPSNPRDENVSVRRQQRPDDSEEEDSEEETVNHNIYKMTDPKDWRKIEGRSRGRTVEPIPFTRSDGNADGDEMFNVKITEEELAALKDKDGDIRFYKVFEWLLPQYGGVHFWEFIAARMRNYMIHIMNTQAYKPHFYNPEKEVVITAGHVTRFFGCQMGRMLRGFPSIDDT